MKTGVKNVNLTVKSGECLGIIGEIGAGKTTLMRLMSTELLPTTGIVTFVGHHYLMLKIKVKSPYLLYLQRFTTLSHF